MHTHLSRITIPLLIALSLLAIPPTSLAANPASVRYKGKVYYKVLSTNQSQNTGDKVCALVGKTCLGATNLGNNDVCKAFHPNAKTLTSVNGTKNGFFCDGAPQKGLACENFKNTCEVCPTCAVNTTCSTNISDQFREIYVECGIAPKSSSSSSSRKSSSSSSSKKSSSSSSVSSKRSSSSSSVASYPFGPYPGTYACDFYQKARKVVTCRAVKAADTFCVVAMQSKSAKAVECNDNGRIVCTKPCVTNPKEVTLTKCAYDPERRRGYDAPPLDFCALSIKR